MLKKISYWFVVQVISAALKCFIIMFCHTVYLNRNVFKNQKTEGAAHFQLTKRDRIAQLSLLKDRTSVALNIIPNRLYEHTEYHLLTNTSGFSVELLLQRLTPTVFYIQVFFFFYRSCWQFIRLHAASSGATKGFILLFSHMQSSPQRPVNTL